MALVAKPVTATTIVMRVPDSDKDGLYQRVTTHTHASGSTVVTETFNRYGDAPQVQVAHTP